MGMFNLIPISIFIVSLGGLIYIVSNHLSEFENEEGADESSFGIKAKFADWFNQLPLEDVKSQSLSLTQKLLHRTRILLLKADNGLMKIIGKIAEKENNNGIADNGKKPEANFWQDFSDKKEKEEKIELPMVEPTVKIDFAVKDERVEKFFDSVRNLAGKEKEMDIKKPVKVINEVVIRPIKVSNRVDIKPARKSTRAKKSSK